MRPHTPKWIIRVATVVLAAATVAGCAPADDPSSGTGGGSSTEVAGQLDALTVAEPGSMAGYSREKFPHWDSTGPNCDVRDSVLERDGENVQLSGCNVVDGTWNSRYDGQVLDSPDDVDVDHVVPLANAWRSGAAEWTDEQRQNFANDLENPQLVAVSASSNRAKGDQDPSTWKPPQSSAWCAYAKDWITVKAAWKLTVTTAEKSALTDMLGKC